LPPSCLTSNNQNFLNGDDVSVGLDKAKEKGVLFRLPLKKAARTMTAK
jgi:hypothetical protein